LIKGDGLISKGHTIYSDDHGASWQLGSTEFGAPFLANECQAVELADSSILINARSVTNNRIQVVSHDGGLTFRPPSVADTLIQPPEGCEGSIVRHTGTNTLYFSIPYTKTVTRVNMTIFASHDDGAHWNPFLTVDEGSVAYSALSIDYAANVLELLYERSDNLTVVFEPQEIRYVRIQL
jgi:sialidase-1